MVLEIVGFGFWIGVWVSADGKLGEVSGFGDFPCLVVFLVLVALAICSWVLLAQVFNLTVLGFWVFVVALICGDLTIWAMIAVFGFGIRWAFGRLTVFGNFSDWNGFCDFG